MIADRARQGFVLAFVLLFFAYLFGPLIIMSVTAFNSANFPRVTPWDCFSVEWFGVLFDDAKVMNGLRNSVVIGLGVVALSVPLGLAGALMLMQVGNRVRPVFYTVVVSPILIPGVVLGISTIIFWDRLGTMFGPTFHSTFYDGMFLTILGQSTFVSAYSMLVFIARLQRFDPALEEAALDLGATHVQTFRKIMLPFLKPAIASASVLAFLASFENYNTTVFTRLNEETLTTVLASKVRYGINPSISALAVIIVAVTLFFAIASEIARRRQQDAAGAAERVAAGRDALAKRRRGLATDPAMIMLVLVFAAGIGTAYFGGTIGVDECKVAVAEERRRIIEQRIREREQLQMFQSAQPGSPQAPAAAEQPAVPTPATGGYQNIFAPENLTNQSGTAPADGGQEEAAPAAPERAPGTEGYLNMFAPENLTNQSGTAPADGGQEEAAPAAPERAPGTEGYLNMFAPENLTNQSGTAPAGGGQEEAAPAARERAPGTEGHLDLFDPTNLKGQAGQ